MIRALRFKTFYFVAITICLIPIGFYQSQHSIGAYFSPKGGCTDAIVSEIAKAQKCIYCQAYSFTSEPIADALVKAEKRGVYVEVVLDKSQKAGAGSKAEYCSDNKIPVYIDSKHAIAHNKVMVIDSQTLITGSFNFTKNAEESNAENLLIIKGEPDLVSRYIENYEKHKDHSKKFIGEGTY